MANTLAPFGLRPVRKIDGSSPNYAVKQYPILYSYTTPIGTGDLVTLVDGYLQKAAYNNTAHNMIGVFMGAEFYDTTQAKPIFFNAWTGTTTALEGSVVGYVCTDLDMIFEVQSTGAGPVTTAQVNENATFVAAPTVNTITGLSTLTLNADTIATTSTFPFRIVGLSTRVNNDNASANNIVEVIFNDQTFKTLTGV